MHLKFCISKTDKTQFFLSSHSSTIAGSRCYASGDLLNAKRSRKKKPNDAQDAAMQKPSKEKKKVK